MENTKKAGTDPDFDAIGDDDSVTTTKDTITGVPQENDVPVNAVLENAEPPKSVFTRSKANVPFVRVGLTWPSVLPNTDPFIFSLRLKMSKEASERREEYLALAPTEQAASEDLQYLEELCDLITEEPKGFGDLVYDGVSWGTSFKNYVLTADAASQVVLYGIVRGAAILYWRKVSPLEFRTEI